MHIIRQLLSVHVCSSHMIIFGILVPQKQWWRMQGAVEQSHRCRCSADSLKFPGLAKTDYLKSFPSRALSGSAVTNMVRHTSQNMKQNKTKQTQTLCKCCLLDCKRYKYTKFKYNIFCISDILCLEDYSLSFQKNWLSDISIFTIVLLPAVNKNSSEKLSTYVPPIYAVCMNPTVLKAHWKKAIFAMLLPPEIDSSIVTTLQRPVWAFLSCKSVISTGNAIFLFTV